jgi:hypothetical protein
MQVTWKGMGDLPSPHPGRDQEHAAYGSVYNFCPVSRPSTQVEQGLATFASHILWVIAPKFKGIICERK